jgi:hypothetical protein
VKPYSHLQEHIRGLHQTTLKRLALFVLALEAPVGVKTQAKAVAVAV